MKRTHIAFFTSILVLSSMYLGCSKSGESSEATADQPMVLDVYSYDSFASEWGPGPGIIEAFTSQTGIVVNLHAPGDAVTVLNQLILEKDQPRADVVVGLDDSLLKRALEAEVLIPYESPSLDTVPADLVFDRTYHLLPYDYGHFAICYDSEVLETPPSSLEDLASPKYADSLVITDPRTSTPGLGFLLWTASVYGDEWESYWERLRPSILTVTDSWSQAYALFTAGEVPLVLSYGTSPVYHVEYEDSRRYLAAEFSEGHIRQVEGMGIVSGTDSKEAAKAFIDFMLGGESQTILAMSNIMLPVNADVALAPSFDYALRPTSIVTRPDELIEAEAVEEMISRWTEVFTR